MLIENVVMGAAIVIAMKRWVFEDKLRNILLFGAVSAAAAIFGQVSRGTPMNALLMGPLAFVLMAGGIELCHTIEAYLDRRALMRGKPKNTGDKR